MSLRRKWQVATGQQETPFDGEVLAWSVSLLFHASVLLFLAALTLFLPTRQRLLLSAASVQLEKELVPEHFEFSPINVEQLGALAEGGAAEASPVAPLESAESEIVVQLESTTDFGELPAMEFSDPILEAPQVSDFVALVGEGTVGMTGVAGAIDRITNEILLSLDSRRTLVVWLFDQSGSLQAQREEIVQRFDRVYDELGVLEAAGNPAFKRHKNKPLLTSVAQFGKDVTLLTPKPTDEIDEIKSAVRSVTADSSGVENVFTAIGYLANQMKHYRLKAPRRNVMIVVFTDEAGDDARNLDATIDLCTKYAMQVYVVGVPAPFGRKDAYVRYQDPNPDFDQRTQWLPVHQGPESLYPERLRLNFSREVNEQAMLDSGFGPFGLTRMTYETGGIFFAVHPNRDEDRNVRRMETTAMSAFVSRFFDPVVMRAYRPDYVSNAQYMRLASENRAKQALLKAARQSWVNRLARPRLRFPNVDDAEFARALSTAQRAAAEVEPAIREIVGILQEGELDRSKLVKPRWQAGFDLAIGTALAAKVRAEGYNGMLAQARQGITFKDDRNDTWLLRPSAEVASGSVLERQARLAEQYLRTVVEEHEDTPWALLASQELAVPLGWKWHERFDNVAERRAQNANNQRPQNTPPRPPGKPLRKPPAL